VEADALLPRLEDLALSSGSACSSANPEPSHVLRALGLPEDRVRGAIRIGLGRHTSQDQVDRAAQRIAREVERLRAEAGAVATGTGPR
jgi:cysteine desulfurase